MRSYETLIVMDYYLPGRMAGGPVTTISNLIQQLGSELDALIVTRNNDLGGDPYSGIEPWSLHRVGGTDVLYLPAMDFTAQSIDRVAQTFSVKQIYLNSFFSPITVAYLLLIRTRKFARNSSPIVLLAPRGEFSQGALSLKAGKKSVYLKLFKLLKLDHLVNVFQASSAMEKADIGRILGEVPIKIVPDMAARVDIRQPQTFQLPKLAFLSRISPMKNLLGALHLLMQVQQPCQFDIYGPKEDLAYWEECEAQIARLPSHITVTYKGTVEHDRVLEVLGGYSALLLPTKGENFGHVIFEALAAGCPAIISDQTPWQDLADKGVGWVYPLQDEASFVQAIEQVLQDSLVVRQERARRCMSYARAVSEDEEVIQANLNLFAYY